MKDVIASIQNENNERLQQGPGFQVHLLVGHGKGQVFKYTYWWAVGWEGGRNR